MPNQRIASLIARSILDGLDRIPMENIPFGPGQNSYTTPDQLKQFTSSFVSNSKWLDY